jgi:Rho GTPase-activating protein 39
VTENSAPPSPSSSKSRNPLDDFARSGSSSKAKKEGSHAKTSRSRSSTVTSHRPQAPQSLDAALEKINVAPPDDGPASPSFKDSGYLSESTRSYRSGSTPSHSPPASPQIPASRPMLSSLAGGPTVGGKPISSPILNHGKAHSNFYLRGLTGCGTLAATLQMSPVKNRASSRPIAVVPKINIGHSDATPSRTSLSTGYVNADIPSVSFGVLKLIFE